jgi:serine/threonine protein phosphatase 1
MSARTIAIGDIHGCSQALGALIQAIDPAADDTVVLLGDYVDRGPDTKGAIEMILDLERRCRVASLLGNHDLMLLDAVLHSTILGPWLECGGAATVRSYEGKLSNVPPEHLAFLRRCKRYYETPTHFFVHANYAHEVALDEQPDYLLFWEHLQFHIPAPHENGKIAIVGHTAQKSGEILDLGHIICLDTFCYASGWLTAMDIESGHIWQADRKGRLRAK